MGNVVLSERNVLGVKMTLRLRYLGGVNTSTTARGMSEKDRLVSDMVVIITALLCGVICVVCLITCAWIRQIANRIIGHSGAQLPANKGLKKEILDSLPKLTFSVAEHACSFSDCAICLTEFIDGDELRVLPQCSHGYHVGCIDTWFGSHSSCPSCRQIVVVTCENCGEVPTTSAITDPTAGTE